MRLGDDSSIQEVIKIVIYRYPDVSIRYSCSLGKTDVLFILKRGDREFEYHIPDYDFISLTPVELETKLIGAIENMIGVIKDKLISKKEEDMTLNLGTVDSLATKINARIYNNMTNPLTTTACINRILSDALCKPMVKKIIKSGPCTIVIWEDGSKTIVRLREGEKDDEFAAFSAAVVKKLYGSNSAVTKLLKKKTFVQEKKGPSGDVIPKMLRDLGEAIKKKAPVQDKKESQ